MRVGSKGRALREEARWKNICVGRREETRAERERPRNWKNICIEKRNETRAEPNICVQKTRD